ncbi:class I SAM-dependent methyltransferase [Streptomyces acidiscabies]|uniref:class I SAM-dependent methyltransferase n=1 Tax=Streptomyces acidiscabies TaxID=42234 RepID=UPI00095AE70B|nr:class I SAM-dependent methyltransferase [Streptomyces acidiscabies]GAV44013.1 phenylpyruvate C(3-methyltransferase [Streptomyces acidiscabies]
MTTAAPLSMRQAFNGTVLASAVTAAAELGLLDVLDEHRTCALDAFAREHDLSPRALRLIVDALESADAVATVGDGVTLVPGPRFTELWENKGYFVWLVKGYAPILAQADDLARTGRGKDAMRLRDGAAIARAGRDYGHFHVDPVFESVTAGLDFTCAADLGCGSGRRIIQLALRHPGKRFVGIDIDAGAIEVATKAVADAGLSDRVEIVHGDISRLEKGRHPGVDLVFSFFLGHDLWPLEDCVASLGRLREAFPDVRRLLLSDTYRSDLSNDPAAPVFSLGFEYTHALMDQYIPDTAEWEDAFARSPWHLDDRTELDIPHSCIFHLTPRS